MFKKKKPCIFPFKWKIHLKWDFLPDIFSFTSLSLVLLDSAAWAVLSLLSLPSGLLSWAGDSSSCLSSFSSRLSFRRLASISLGRQTF